MGLVSVKGAIKSPCLFIQKGQTSEIWQFLSVSGGKFASLALKIGKRR